MPSADESVNKSTGKHAITGLDPGDLRKIQQALPDSTHAERLRFLKDRTGKCERTGHQSDTEAAIDKLGNYLEWRRKFCTDEFDHIKDPWEYATKTAIRAWEKEYGKDIDDGFHLPRNMFILNEGDQKYVYCIPARCGLRPTDDYTIYVHSLALCVDRVADRNSTERVILVIDTRPGLGWKNTTSVENIRKGLTKYLVRLLADLHPLRLDSAVLVPVPRVFMYLWKAMKPFVGTNTRDKVSFVYGSAGMNDKLPRGLKDHVDEEMFGALEKIRSSCMGSG